MLLYLRHMAERRLVDSSFLIGHDLDVLRVCSQQVLLVLLEGLLTAGLQLLGLLELLLVMLLLVSDLLRSVLIELLDLEVVVGLGVASGGAD